jgi:Glutathione S-transferase, N-terminal domain
MRRSRVAMSSATRTPARSSALVTKETAPVIGIVAEARVGGVRLQRLGFAVMILYTCGQKKTGPAFAHPCAKAAKALDAAGYQYELRTVGGYRLMPWTWGSRDEERAEVRRLSDSNEVPILVLDDGEVVSGSGTIARWAREHPAMKSPSR